MSGSGHAGAAGVASYIAVIEDEQAVLDTILATLPGRVAFADAYRFVGFASGREAVDWVEREHETIELPLVVCDLFLDPGSPNGRDVLRRIRGASPSTRCILLSGVAEREDLQQAFNDGVVDAFFAKPDFLSSSDFHDKVNRLLDEWREERAERRGTCFVAMPYDVARDRLYREVLQPAIQSLGFTCVRQDEQLPLSHVVVEDMRANIAAASLVVADVSGSNPNVLYEVGLAHALSRPVVLFSDRPDESAFDVRSFAIAELPHGSDPDTAVKAVRSVLQRALAG